MWRKKVARWFGLGPAVPPDLVVVREVTPLVEELRRTLATAPRREVAGLRRAVARAQAAAARPDEEVLLAWVRREVGSGPQDQDSAAHRRMAAGITRQPSMSAG